MREDQRQLNEAQQTPTSNANMSYREWLAGLAMQGMQFNGDYDGGTLDASEKRQKLARAAFAVADAMIKEARR